MGAGIYITGIGARTSVGLRAWNVMAAARAGLNRFAEHPYMVDRFGDPVRVAADESLPLEAPANERMLQLAASALAEVFEALGSELPNAALTLVLPESRPGFTSQHASSFLGQLRRMCPLLSQLAAQRVDIAPTGHAGGLAAFAKVAEAIARGFRGKWIVGGVDSYIDADTLQHLDELGRLHNLQDSRTGFIPGEAAAFCVLGRPDGSRHDLPAVVELLSVGTATEPHPYASQRVCVGDGLTSAVRSAASQLQLPAQKIGTTYCDINGERYRTEEFMFSALRNYAAFVDTNRFDAPADVWGDIGAASGPMLAALATASALRAWAPHRHVLLWTSSDAGLRSAVSLKLHHDARVVELAE